MTWRGRWDRFAVRQGCGSIWHRGRIAAVRESALEMVTMSGQPGAQEVAPIESTLGMLDAVAATSGSGFMDLSGIYR